MLFCRVMVATAFIVFGNIFLVAFGNHQSPGTGLKPFFGVLIYAVANIIDGVLILLYFSTYVFELAYICTDL